MAFEWLRRRRQPAEVHAAGDEVIARMVPAWQVNQPLWSVNDYQRLAEDGYRRNIVIAACIKEIARSVAEPTLQTIRQNAAGEPDVLPDTHPLSLLLAQPNPEQARFEFFERLLIHLHVGGNAYVHKVRAGSMRGARVMELWLLRPDRVKIIPGADGRVRAFRYSADGIKNEDLEPEDVVQVSLPDPLDDYYGLSPIAIAARCGDLDNSAVDFLRNYFTNGGVPRGFLKFKVRVPKEERKRVQKDFDETYGGPEGWHTTGVLDADVDYQQTGTNVDDLDLESVFDASESRICAVFGVPPILIAIAVGLKRSTYSNYAQAEKSFWNETLMPMYRRLADRLTLGIASEFGEDLAVQFDLSAVEALQESRESRRTLAQQGWAGGYLTKNEVRQLCGYEPVIGGDVFRQDMSSLEEPVVMAEAAARTEQTEVLSDLRRTRDEIREILKAA